ncbi:MAG: AAA family ATPase [Actinomycetes bacterium]
MATHGERPEPPDGRYGYLSSLGLDDAGEDAFDVPADDAGFGAAWPAGPAGQDVAPDAGGAPGWTPDPTAAWVLPQAEDEVPVVDEVAAPPQDPVVLPGPDPTAFAAPHAAHAPHAHAPPEPAAPAYEPEARPAYDEAEMAFDPGPDGADPGLDPGLETGLDSAFVPEQEPDLGQDFRAFDTSFDPNYDRAFDHGFDQAFAEEPEPSPPDFDHALGDGTPDVQPHHPADDFGGGLPESLMADPEHAFPPGFATQADPVPPFEHDLDWRTPPPDRGRSPDGTSMQGRTGERLSAEMLTADTVLRPRQPRPTRGWRRTVFTATGGRVNLGMSSAELREQALINRARSPLAGCHRLAVISLKGGVGKTTTTAALGAMFADLRGDRVIAVDANPDRGTLGERVPRETQKTVRGLLDARDQLTRYADVRSYTSQAPTRLEVLASDSDPGVSQAFSEQDYRETVTTLERFYNLILTDCGTGLLHSAMQGILGLADSLVIVSSASLDGARSAAATLDWLDAHGFADIVSRSVTVISTVRPGGGTVDVDRLQDHFARRCRAVVSIPYDPHLEEGGVLDLDELDPDTREAYYELAAEVGEGFRPST